MGSGAHQGTSDEFFDRLFQDFSLLRFDFGRPSPRVVERRALEFKPPFLDAPWASATARSTNGPPYLGQGRDSANDLLPESTRRSVPFLCFRRYWTSERLDQLVPTAIDLATLIDGPK